MIPSDLGKNLRAVRAGRSISLRELGRLAGMAPASISTIENGRSSPTLATLHKLLHALGTDFAEFFMSPPAAPHDPVFKAREMKVLEDRSRRYVIPFPKRDDIRFEAIVETIKPTRRRSQWETLDCDMAGIVLEGGALTLEVRDEGEWSVTSGDAFYVHEGSPHRATNLGREPVRVITIYYPPRY